MTARQRPRQPRIASERPKVPLTYYRSKSNSPGQETPTSPFRHREIKKGRGRKFLVRSIDILVVAAIVFGIGYSLVVKPDPIIKASNYTYRPGSDYAEAASKYLGATINRTKMTLDEASIAGPLQKQFPEISSISIELPLIGQRPILHLSIAKPSLFLTGNDQSFVVDADGVAVAKSTDLPGITKLPTLDDQTGFDIVAGQQALSVTSINFINTLLAQCKRAGVPVKSLTLPPVPLELDLRTSDKPYFVKFYMDGDGLIQSGQFLAARHQFSQKGPGPSQYLDVRVEGKVFYK